MIIRGVLVVVFFVVLSLLIFGSVINGELISIDDPDQMERIAKRNAWNIEGTFIRKDTTGLYYRPLITLSFTADKLLWGADTRAMHLVNIVLHTFNALMVVFLTRFLFISNPYRWHFSVLGGVLFLCHPLTAESVNWLSGRTDILAATFVFGSALALLKFRQNKCWLWFVCALILAAGGVLAKETSIAFLAGFGFLLWAQQNPAPLNVKRVAQRIAVLIGLLSVSGGAAWFLMIQMRELVLKSDSSRIGLTLRIIDNDWNYSIFVCLRALGFYFKKIFLPLPLNFAIVEVDPLYELLALPLLVVLIFLFVQRSMVAGYLLTASAMVAPAFPIAFNQIAWTPYAERYVYIALGFVVPAAAVLISRLTISPRLCMLVSVGLAGVLFSATLHRSWQWTTNELLWADTVKKSPLSEKAWNNYGVALMEHGEYVEAGKKFAVAASLTGFGYKDKYDINMGVAMMKRHDYAQALHKLLEVVELSKGKSDRALDVLVEVVDAEAALRDVRLEEVRSTLQHFADTANSSGYYYQLGRLAKTQQQNVAAKSFFEKAYAVAPDSDPIKKKAEYELNAIP